MPLMGLPLTLLILHQTAPGEQLPPGAACPDRLRVDLSMRTSVQTPDICISPGRLTGFVFDRPASADLQEELRFGEVLRGRTGISFVPPPGLLPGERLRLTVHFAQDPPEQAATFMLVASPARATHQVDVFHDARSRESLWREIEEERMKNQQLRAENQSLRGQLTTSSALGQVVRSGDLTKDGIQARPFRSTLPLSEQGQITLVEGISFRTAKRVAVYLVLNNLGPTSWTVTAARVTDAQGRLLKDFDFSQVWTPHGKSGEILIETASTENGFASELTLTLIGADAQSITIPHIQLP